MSANAYEQIRNLLGTYTESMDAGRFADLAELFRDATMVNDSGAVIADGYDAVRQNYERGTQLYDGSPRTKHVTANSIIEVDEDAGTATARSAYVVFQGTDALAAAADHHRPVPRQLRTRRGLRPLAASASGCSSSTRSAIFPTT